MVANPLRRLTTVRARSTFAATLVVGIALVVAGVAAVTFQRSALVSAIDSGLVARADDVAALVEGGSVPVQLAVAGEDDALVQIVNSQGIVVASSENIEGESAITGIRAGSETRLITSDSVPIGDGRLRLAARTVSTAEGEFTVYTATNLESVTETVALLSAMLLVGIPILTGFVGLTVWVIIGRSLRPVEHIRSQVASIGDRELDRRVPVPGSDDEIGRLAVTMNEMLGRLERSSEQQRRFVADASHELRSPLAVIRSALEVNQAHPTDADWPEVASDVLDEALRMQRLIEDLLMLARIDADKLPALTTAVDLDDLVFEQSHRLQQSTDVTIDTAAVSGAQVSGDRAGLDRMVRNLIENAVRYATKSVRVSLTEADGMATLVIDDDGPGIPEADRERVLGRFTRLDEARDREHGGSGLGLSIVKEVVDRYGGVLAVGESPVGGARFQVDFPAVADLGT